jgi:Tol biopolymer transport system component
VDLFAADLTTGAETLVSGNLSGALANGSSTSPVISGDGRDVVFTSKATDLVANDTNRASDIFVRDRLLGVTMLVSANAQGRAANGPSTRPVLAADGRTVVFQSFANDLVNADYNGLRDLFVLKLGGADTDHDGLDDDWEVTYFNSLSRDGSGDFDADGVSDRDEFLAGTNPTANASVFRVLTVVPAGGGGTLVLWIGNPNRTYRVEYKDDLDATDWTALNGSISWNGSTASISDASASSPTHRFYRVARLP